MTTIAVNKNSMACDLQYSHSGGMKFLGGPKCYLIEGAYSECIGTPRAIFGMCGDADQISNYWMYLHNPEGKPPKGKLEGEVVALKADHTIWCSRDLRSWLQVKEPYYAIGSGMHYAISAMASGKTPLQAVKIASKYDIYTGKGFKEFTL